MKTQTAAFSGLWKMTKPKYLNKIIPVALGQDVLPLEDVRDLGPPRHRPVSQGYRSMRLL